MKFNYEGINPLSPLRLFMPHVYTFENIKEYLIARNSLKKTPDCFSLLSKREMAGLTYVVFEGVVNYNLDVDGTRNLSDFTGDININFSGTVNSRGENVGGNLNSHNASFVANSEHLTFDWLKAIHSTEKNELSVVDFRISNPYKVRITGKRMFLGDGTGFS